jgi:DNA polymerase bacteriophage-type
MPVLHRDIETRSVVDLGKAGAWRYAADSSTSVRVFGYAVDDGPKELWKPGMPIPAPYIEAANDPSWTVVAHNDQFETAIEALVLGPRFDWPQIPLRQHVCTMARARALAYPGSLEGAARAAGIALRKDVEGHAAMLRLSKPRKPRKGEDRTIIHWHESESDLLLLDRYVIGDVELERQLFRVLPPLIDSEQKIWVLDQIINRRGFHTDVALAIAVQDIVKAERVAIKEAITDLTKGRITSPNQRDRILAFLQERGHQIQSLQKRAVASLLAGSPNDEVRQLLERRRDGSKTAAHKFKALLASVDEDGRIRGTLNYHGCGPGRWSGKGFQPQNLAKRIETKDIDAAVEAILARDIGRVRELGAPITVAGDVSRAAIIARAGHVLMGADFSAVESRALAHLAGETWKVEAYRKFDETGDPRLEMYCVLASRALGREVTPVDEEGRDFGKTNDLAFGYSGSVGAWRKFDPSDKYADEEVLGFARRFREEHPATVRLWNALEKAAKLAVLHPDARFELSNKVAFEMEGKHLFMELPSGRRICYPEARIGPGKYEDTTQVHFKDNARGGWTDVSAWRGSFTENLVQAFCRDLLAAAMLRLESVGTYKPILHVHDEIICEIPEGSGSEEEFLRLMTELPEWAAGMPLAAKAWTRKRFAKTKKPAAPASETAALILMDAAQPAAQVAAISVDPAAIAVDPEDDEDEPVSVSMADLVTEPIEGGKVRCPFHDDHAPSCHLYHDHYYCFACGANGSRIDWLVRVEGMSPEEAVAALANWERLSEPRSRSEDADNIANALRLWEESQPIAGTLAEQYLASRNIAVAALPADIGGVLRFHPRCPFGPSVRHPCLVALFRDVVTDAPAGIHRTALTADGRKVDRMSLGPWPGSRAIKIWPANGQLFVGEGIETVLAAATRLRHRGELMQPAWAIGSSGALGKFSIVPSVKHLRVLVDNDDGGGGRASAERCAQRWNHAGRTVSLLVPPRGSDFNDVARSVGENPAA